MLDSQPPAPFDPPLEMEDDDYEVDVNVPDNNQPSINFFMFFRYMGP